MTGGRDLAVLLATMEPVGWQVPYGYALLPPGQTAPDGVFALIHEVEGATVIAPLDCLASAGIEATGDWARISLTVHSALAAVGLTAAVAGALAAEGISANVVAGFFHDHLFVPWDRRADAIGALRRLARNGA